MATPIRLRLSLLPQCSACTRRLTNAGLDGYSNHSFQQQVRGKKKASNVPSTLTVRLLKPVETFGKAGAYVPISVGQMRNEWFPRRIAEYVTSAALKDLHARNVPIERDFEAGLTPLEAKKVASDSSTVAAPAAQKARAIEVERLSPQRSLELLTILLPPHLDFYRTPNPPTASPSSPSASSTPVTPHPSIHPSASPPPTTTTTTTTTTTRTPIFGSVSTTDILGTIRALMADNDEAARVLLGEDDVRFVGRAAEEMAEDGGRRVRVLGEFEVDIGVRGGEGSVRRRIRVLPGVL